MPRISAACHQPIFFDIAYYITSCTFIARSMAASVEEFMRRMVSYHRPKSGHITC
jgi:hypothetical protein